MQDEDARSLIGDVMFIVVVALFLVPLQVLKCIQASNLMSKTKRT